MSKKPEFRPPWYPERTPDGTYRSLFKWADPAELKHPNNGLVALLMEYFDLTRADFAAPLNLALDLVPDDQPCKLPEEHLAFLSQTCGPENLRTDTYERTAKSYGAGMLDALRLRRKIIENLPDAVVAPRNQAEIEAIVKYADEKRIPIYVFGGGSTVTRGFEATRQGSIAIDMSKHMRASLPLMKSTKRSRLRPVFGDRSWRTFFRMHQNILEPSVPIPWDIFRNLLQHPVWVAGSLPAGQDKTPLTMARSKTW